MKRANQINGAFVKMSDKNKDILGNVRLVIIELFHCQGLVTTKSSRQQSVGGMLGSFKGLETMGQWNRGVAGVGVGFYFV